MKSYIKMIPCWENHPRTKLHLFWISQAICSHPIEETLPETDMIRNCFLFSSLSSRKVGRRLRKRLPLPQWSTMQSTDGWMYLYTRVAWYVIFLNSLPCMYVLCSILYICVCSVYFTLEKLVPKKFGLHLVKPNIVGKKDTQIYFNWITIISVQQDVIFDTKMGLKCNHAKYRAPKKPTFT